MMIFQTLMRAILLSTATIFGSIGMVAFYGSFRHHDAAIYAIILICTASAITLGIGGSRR